MADDAKLIAVIEANTASFERALKRLEGVTKSSTDRMTASVKKLDQQIGLVGNSMNKLGKAVTFTAAIGMAKQLASTFAEVAKNAGDLADAADKIGISTKSLQELRYAAKQSGVDIGQLDGALSKLSKGLAEARTGSGDLRKLLLANGMSEAQVKALSFEQALNKVADLIKNAKDATDAAKISTLAFGKANDELVNMLRDGKIGLDAFRKAAEDTGQVLGEDGVRKLAAYDDKLQELTGRWHVAVDEMTLWALTALEKIGEVEHAAADAVAAAAAAARDAVNAVPNQGTAAAAGAAAGGQIGTGAGARISRVPPVPPTDPATAAAVAAAAARKAAADAAAAAAAAKSSVVPPSGGGGAGGGGGGPSFGGEVRQLQASTAAIRKLALDRELEAILEAASKKAGVIVEVTSGGQAKIGTGGPRTGSTRHDLGRAADLRLRDPVTGQILNMNNPADLARIQSFIAASASAGATGIGMGAGYMGTQTMHVGMGKTATWGGAPWLAGTVAAGRANPMFVEGREQARLGEAEKQSQELADNFEKTQQNAVEAADATLKINDALTNANQAFKRDLVGGFVRDLERGVKPAEAIANALMKIGDRLLDSALNALFPDVGGGILGAVFAGGGVMTGRGPMPLRKYAGGGVAHSPQMAMFGEGGRPEAFVPLPDGRRIPVNIRVPGMGGLGNGRGGQAVAVHNRVTVDPSPMFLVTTHAIARQGGRDAVVEAGDQSRRRPGGR